MSKTTTVQIDDRRDTNGKWVTTFQRDYVKYRTKSYSLWTNMKSRCKPGGAYQRKSPAYVGCYLSPEFSDFQKFMDWHTNCVGYGSVDYEIDKDILLPNNTCYSPSTCFLVPRALNLFLTPSNRNMGKFPLGVILDYQTRKFRARVVINQRRTDLGGFHTQDEAYQAYKLAKEAEAYRWYERLRDGEFAVDAKVIEHMRTWVLEDNIINQPLTIGKQKALQGPTK